MNWLESVMKTAQGFGGSRSQRPVDVTLGYYADASGAQEIKATSGLYGTAIEAQLRARKTLTSDRYGLALAYASNPIVYRCVDLRSQKVSKVKGSLYRKDSTGRATGDEIIDHPFWDALRVTRQQWGKDLFYQWQHAKCVWGEAFIEKVPDQFGMPYTFRWLNPTVTEPNVFQGRITYFEYAGDDFMFQYAPERVIYDFYHNPLDDLRGLPPMQVALKPTNIVNGVADYHNSFFQNDARPGGILSARQGTVIQQSDQNRLLQFFKDQLQGARNRFKPIFMPAALEWQNVQQPPAPEHDTIDRTNVRKICDAFGVPVQLVDFDEERFQLSEEPEKLFYENTIIPECEDLQLLINEQMLPFLGADDVVFEFDFAAVRALIDDQVKRTNALNSRTLAGNTTINEARTQYGLDPVTGGDVFMIPKAVTIIPQNELQNAVELTAQQPEQNTAAEVSGQNAPQEKEALKEISQWAEVARKRGIDRARTFKAAYLPESIAHSIRAQLYGVDTKAVYAEYKDVFEAARRELVGMFTLSELNTLQERLAQIGAPYAA